MQNQISHPGMVQRDQKSGSAEGEGRETDFVSFEAKLVKLALQVSATLGGIVGDKDQLFPELAEVLECRCDAVDDKIAVPGNSERRVSVGRGWTCWTHQITPSQSKRNES
jgi:hypothetical protein